MSPSRLCSKEKGESMPEMSLRFKLDDCQSIDELALQVGDWETQARERSERSSVSHDLRLYYQGVADAMHQVRLQFSKLQVGIQPATRNVKPGESPLSESHQEESHATESEKAPMPE